MAITGLEIFTKEILTSLPDLKVISKYGVGLDMIDLETMRKLKKRLGWTGGVNKRAVTELVLSLTLNLLRKTNIAFSQTKNGLWDQIIGSNLTGKTFGIIGCGNIGKDLVRVLQPFDCKILVNDIINFDKFYKKYNIFPVGIDELLKNSEIISLHIPLDETTKNIISADKMKLIKSEAIIINTARGGLIDEKELKKMLLENRLAGAALDVFSTEPPDDKELLNIPNLIATPHIGGSSKEVIISMGRAAIEGLEKNEIP